MRPLPTCMERAMSDDVLERLKGDRAAFDQDADRWPEHRSLFRIVNDSLTAAIARIESLQAEVERLRNPWVRVEDDTYPPIDPDENNSMSLPVCIAVDGDSPNPLDDVVIGWAYIAERKWYREDGRRLKCRIKYFAPIPELPQQDQEEA